MKIRRGLLLCAGTAAVSLLSATAVAQVAEDDSAAFQADNEALSAAMGLPAAESTFRTNPNGSMSAVMGMSAMKMLVVKQNPDGSLSYGHVSSEDELKKFSESSHSHGPAEE